MLKRRDNHLIKRKKEFLFKKTDSLVLLAQQIDLLNDQPGAHTYLNICFYCSKHFHSPISFEKGKKALKNSPQTFFFTSFRSKFNSKNSSNCHRLH